MTGLSDWDRAKRMLAANPGLVNQPGLYEGTRVVGFRVPAALAGFYEGVDALQKVQAVIALHDDLVACVRAALALRRSGLDPDWKFLRTTLARAENATD